MRTASASTISSSTDVSAPIETSRSRARVADSAASVRAPSSPSRRVAVAVEDVVDDLEEKPQLLGERPPRRLLCHRDVCHPQPHPIAAAKRRPVLSLCSPARSVWSPDVEVLPADHSQRRLGQLAGDLGCRIDEREPERLCEERVAGEQAGRLAECAHVLGRPRRSSSSSTGRSSWTSENLCTS